MFFRRFFLSDVDGLLYGGQLRFGNSQVRVENLPYVMLQVELKHLPCCCSAFRRGRAEHTTPASGWGGSTDVDVVGCFSTTGLTSEKPEPSIGHTCVPVITGSSHMWTLFKTRLSSTIYLILFDRTVLWNSLWKASLTPLRVRRATNTSQRKDTED